MKNDKVQGILFDQPAYVDLRVHPRLSKQTLAKQAHKTWDQIKRSHRSINLPSIAARQKQIRHDEAVADLLIRLK